MKPKTFLRIPVIGGPPAAEPREGGGLEQTALRGAGVFLIRYGVGFILNFGGSVIVARSLGPRLWGLYAISYFILTLYSLLSLGVWGFLVQNSQEPGPTEIGTCFTLQHILGILGAVFTILVVAPALSDYFQEGALASFVTGAGVGGYFYAWRWPSLALAERRMEYRSVAIAETVDIFAFNACAVAGVVVGDGVFGLAVGNAVRGVASALYSHFRISRQVRLTWNLAALKKIARFALPYLAFTLLQWLPVHAGPLLVGFLIDAQALGYVQLAYRILEYPRVVVTLAFRIGMSTYSKVQDQSLALTALVQKSLGLLYWLITPTISLLAALGPWWVPVIYGKAWLPMVDIMFLLAVPFMVTAGYTILATVLSAKEHVREAMRFQAGYNALYWLAAIIFIPKLQHLGLPGAEWVALVAGPILIRDYRRLCGPLPVKGVAVKLVVSCAAMALGWRLSH